MALVQSPSHPSSGRIVAHNLHLLHDDPETERAPSRPEPDDNSPRPQNGLPPAAMSGTAMGGDSPGPDRSTAGAGYPEPLRDSLEEDPRPASNSSAASRGMDDSPVDANPEEPGASLTAEKHYQDDLKERVRQSFKDLGMEPEGVLKDDPSKKGKRGKRRRKGPGGPGSEGSDGGESQDSGDDSGPSAQAEPGADEPAGYGIEPTGYGNEPPEDSNDPAGYGDDPAGYGNDPTGYGNDPASDGNDPAGYGNDPTGYGNDPTSDGNDPAGYGNDPASDGNDPAGYGNDPAGGGNDPAGYGNDPAGYGNDPAGYGNDPAGYGNEPSGYGNNPAGYENDSAGYGNDPADYGGEPPGDRNDPAGYGNDPAGYGNDPAGYGNDPAGYGNDPAGYGNDPAGYGNEPDNYGNEPAAYANEQDTYGNQYGGEPGEPQLDPAERSPEQVPASDHPDDRLRDAVDPNQGYPDPDAHLPRDYPEDPDPNQGYSGALGDDYPADDASPARLPEEEGEPQRYDPDPYPDQDYGDPHHGSDPSADRSNDGYPVGDDGREAAGINQAEESYPEDPRYPDQGGNDGYSEDRGYPDGGSFPDEPSYPQGGGFPDRTADDDAGASGYPKESTPVDPPSYPSRYENNGYADEEEESYNNRDGGRPEDPDPYDQIPRDSLDYAPPPAATNDVPRELPQEYDNRGDSGGNADPYPQEAPEIDPRDSLEYGYPDLPPEQPQPDGASVHRSGRQDRLEDESFNDPAPYDSLEEEEPNEPLSQEVPRVAQDDDVLPSQDPEPQETRPGGPPSASAVARLQRDAAERDGFSSNNSSANSSRDAPQGSSAELRNLPGSRGSPADPRAAGLSTLPPRAGQQRTPSRAKSGQGSGGYAEVARRRGSPASRRGSRGQGSQRQAGSGRERSGRSGADVLSGRNRSFSNRIKTSPIPAGELSAKDFLKRSRDKSDLASAGRPQVEHSNSQIIRKNGEAVKVSYISDDSGDEGEHFLDEKGSPVDQDGRPLYRDLHGAGRRPEEPKVEFRIKPTPPKQKSPLELQAVNARRTSAEDPSARRAPHGGKITIAKPFPVEEPITETAAAETETLDGALPQQQPAQEEPVRKASARPEGLDQRSLPLQKQDRSTQKEETGSPGGSASKSKTPFGEVRLRSVGTIMSGRSMGRTKLPEPDDPYKDLRFEAEAAEEHGRENPAVVEQAVEKDLRAEEGKAIQSSPTPEPRKPLSGTYNKKDFVKSGPTADSRNASRGSYQDRAIQYTPQEGQSRNPPPVPDTQEGREPPPQPPHGQQPQQGYPPQQQGYPPQQQGYPPQQQGYPPQQPNGYGTQQQYEYPPDGGSQGGYRAQPPPPPPPPNQPSQYPEEGQPAPNWEQQPAAPWSDPHQQQPPQQFYSTGPTQYGPQQAVPGQYDPQEGYSGQAYDAQMSRPAYSQQQDQGPYYDQQQQPPPYETGYQGYPGAPQQQQQQPPVPQGYPHPSQGVPQQPPNGPYPNQPGQPGPGYYPNPEPQHPPPPPPQQQQPPPRQRGPPKPKPNFIDMNKVNLARGGPPRKKYSDMGRRAQAPPAPTSTRINPRKPLPGIYREGSQQQNEDPYAEEVVGGGQPGSAQTWAQEDWTRQLVQDQQHLPMRRGHSDTNLYLQQQQQQAHPGFVPQGYHPQPQAPAVPGYGSDFDRDPPAHQAPPYARTYPPALAQQRNPNGQPYSYSADHATHVARNNGLGRPQVSGPPQTRVAFAEDYRNSFDSDVNPMTYANGGGYHPANKRTSPYHVLPDIPGQHRSEETSPLRKSDPDSYTARLLKQRQPPQYKEYTIKDYRNLKNDIRLGGLGPDQDLVQEKQEKVIRQRDYAKVVMNQNKKQLQQTKRLWPKKAVAPQEERPSKRELAIEYSKNIPKPRIPTPPEILHERMYGASSQASSSSRQQDVEEAEHRERAASEMARLEELRARHEREKIEVDRLRADGPA